MALCAPRALDEEPLHLRPELDPAHPDFGTRLAPQVFAAPDAQWDELRRYCLAHDISQRSLNAVVDRLLGPHPALLQFRVQLSALAAYFARDAPLTADLADLFAPHVCLTAPPDCALLPAPTGQTSIARLVLCCHHLCALPMSDLLLRFLACCRNNPALSTSTFVYGFNLQQLLLLLTQHMVPPPLAPPPLAPSSSLTRCRSPRTEHSECCARGASWTRRTR